nr:hypothetical protein [Calothrix sp. MO_167.B42]
IKFPIHQPKKRSEYPKIPPKTDTSSTNISSYYNTETYCNDTPIQNFTDKIPDDKGKQALDNFKTTKTAITGLVNQLAIELAQERVNKGEIQKTEKNAMEEQFKKYIQEIAIKCVLANSLNPKDSGLDYASTFEKNKSYNRKAWVDAIYNYQLKKQMAYQDEFILQDNQDGSIYKKLKEDIKSYIKKYFNENQASKNNNRVNRK